MTLARKRARRSDSATKQQEIMRAVKTGIAPPIAMNPDEREIFDTLISGLPLECWEPPRIRLAANLAKIIAYHEENMRQLQIEGPVLENARGTPVSNPRQAAMAQNASQIKSLMATLGLSASQRGISTTAVAAKKKAEQHAREVLEDLDDDDDGLLAT